MTEIIITAVRSYVGKSHSEIREVLEKLGLKLYAGNEVARAYTLMNAGIWVDVAFESDDLSKCSQFWVRYMVGDEMRMELVH